jgi:Uncharacterized iron-regulated protein
MMYHIPAVLNAEQLAHFTAQLQQADWVDGRATVGSQGATVKITSRLTPARHSMIGCRLQCFRH